MVYSEIHAKVAQLAPPGVGVGFNAEVGVVLLGVEQAYKRSPVDNIYTCRGIVHMVAVYVDGAFDMDVVKTVAPSGHLPEIISAAAIYAVGRIVFYAQVFDVTVGILPN